MSDIPGFDCYKEGCAYAERTEYAVRRTMIVSRVNAFSVQEILSQIIEASKELDPHRINDAGYKQSLIETQAFDVEALTLLSVDGIHNLRKAKPELINLFRKYASVPDFRAYSGVLEFILGSLPKSMVEEPVTRWQELLMDRPEGGIYAAGTIFLGQGGRFPFKDDLLASIGTEEGHRQLLYDQRFRPQFVREAVLLIHDGFGADASGVEDITSKVLIQQAAETVREAAQSAVAAIVPAMVEQFLRGRRLPDDVVLEEESMFEDDSSNETIM